jgi:hypothetical protein
MSVECEVTVAVNPITYREVELSPPVRLETWDDFERFNDAWELFCRRAADRGVEMEIARFEF